MVRTIKLSDAHKNGSSDVNNGVLYGSNAVGIDAGASLWKVFRVHENPEMHLLPSGTLEGVKNLITQWSPFLVGITGASASVVAAALSPVQCFVITEFTAWRLGAPVLAKLGGTLLPDHYLLVSIGTGTSILEINSDEMRRISGSTLGGGTLLGLSRLLGCADSFSDLLTLAAQGERHKVDLFVHEICSAGVNVPLAGDLTASAFGKLDSREPADLAHALIWLIGENIGILCNAIARFLTIQTCVFGGSTLAGNQILELALSRTLMARDNKALFLQDGGFCGAAGAASLTVPFMGSA